MPRDLAILKAFDRFGNPENIVRGSGFTNFSFSPFENDLQINRVREFRTFEGLEKLSQSILRILLTPRGSLIEDPEYGTNLANLVGRKFDSDRYADTRTEIIDALAHYNELNADNPDSNEVIESIEEIRVFQDLDDPRKMNIRIGVVTESGESLRVVAPQVIE
jgi:hypothetical protein